MHLLHAFYVSHKSYNFSPKIPSGDKSDKARRNYMASNEEEGLHLEFKSQTLFFVAEITCPLMRPQRKDCHV